MDNLEIENVIKLYYCEKDKVLEDETRKKIIMTEVEMLNILQVNQ